MEKNEHRYELIKLFDALRFATPEKPLTAHKIARLTRVKDSEGSTNARALIVELMDALKIPIGSNRKGYFIIRDENALFNYIDNLESRMEAINQRKIKIMAYFNSRAHIPEFEQI